MTKTSRTAKSLKNAQVAAFFYLVNLILTFLLRKAFIDYLGAELLGLNSTVQDLLNFLNIAELGISGAVSYMLYRPLFEEDREKINEIVSVQGYLYRKVAYIMIAGAIILICFFPLIFAKAQVESWFPYATFVVLFCNPLWSYLFNYKQIILVAEQKDYKNLYIGQGFRALKKMLQIPAVILLPLGYVYWLVIEFIFSGIGALVLNYRIHKEYPWLKINIGCGKKLKKKYPDILIKTKQLFFHRISSYVSAQITPLIIYSYTSLTLVAVYGNYQLIIYGIVAFLGVIFKSLGAGIGNLVAEGDPEKIRNVFWELVASRFWIASCLCFGFYVLSSPLVSLWVGVQYIIDHQVLIWMVLTAFCIMNRITLDDFISAYGMYQDIWVPLVNIVLAVGLSFLLGAFWGLTGILIGMFASSFFVLVWKPCFLYWNGFQEPVVNYFIPFTGYVVLAVGCGYVVMQVTDRFAFTPSASYWAFIKYGILMVGLYVVFFTPFFYFFSSGLRRFLKRMGTLFKFGF